MKKKKLKKLVKALDRFIDMKENHIRIAENALSRSDQQNKIISTANKQLVKEVNTLKHLNKLLESDVVRPIEDMAKDLHSFAISNMTLDFNKELYMSSILEIITGKQLLKKE